MFVLTQQMWVNHFHYYLYRIAIHFVDITQLLVPYMSIYLPRMFRAFHIPLHTSHLSIFPMALSIWFNRSAVSIITISFHHRKCREWKRKKLQRMHQMDVGYNQRNAFSFEHFLHTRNEFSTKIPFYCEWFNVDDHSITKDFLFSLSILTISNDARIHHNWDEIEPIDSKHQSLQDNGKLIFKCSINFL